MKTFLLLALTIACSSLLFFTHNVNNSQHVSQKRQVPDTAIKVTVYNDSKSGIVIPPYFLGLSYEITSITDTVYFKSGHHKFINLLKNLGPGIMRINGYYINFVPWSNQSRDPLVHLENNYLTVKIATSDVDSLFSFARLSNWKVMLGLNVKTNPSLTKSEISYTWASGKDIIYAFEIGNEPESGFKSNFTDYYSALIPHLSIIKNSFPNIPICGPASLYPKMFVKDFLNTAADKVNFVTVHEYPVGEPKVANNVGQLLDDKFIVKVANFSNEVDSLSKAKKLRYRISECNNFGDEGANVADRFASALWGIDYMFTVASNNALGVNFHGGSRGFTPIFVKKGEVTMPRPLYYGMLFFHLASQGKIVPVYLDKTNPNIKAFAVVGADDKVFVTVLNKDQNHDAKISLNFNKNLLHANLIRLLSPSVFSKDSVTLGGASVDNNGKWKPSEIINLPLQNKALKLSVPKGSAALITVTN